MMVLWWSKSLPPWPRNCLHRSVQVVVGLLPGYIVHLRRSSQLGGSLRHGSWHMTKVTPVFQESLGRNESSSQVLSQQGNFGKSRVNRHYASSIVAAGLGIQLGAHLILQVDDVFRQILFLLLHLLQGVRHVLHPTVVVLQSFLDVTNVKPRRWPWWSATGMHLRPANFPLLWDSATLGESFCSPRILFHGLMFEKNPWSFFTGRFCWQTHERTKRVWIILKMDGEY